MPFDISEALPPKYQQILGGIIMEKMKVFSMPMYLKSEEEEEKEKKVVTLEVILPENAQILSITCRYNWLSIHHMVSEADLTIENSKECTYQFVLVPSGLFGCAFEIDEHKYVSTITDESGTNYVVFYKKLSD